MEKEMHETHKLDRFLWWLLTVGLGVSLLGSSLDALGSSLDNDLYLRLSGSILILGSALFTLIRWVMRRKRDLSM